MLAGLFPEWLDPTHIIETYGAWMVFAIIFAESGLFFGFFLPGDMLLFTAGFLTAEGTFDISIEALLIGLFVAAVAGDQVGYAFGFRVGPTLFGRPDSRFFKQRHLERANEYFTRRGGPAIVVARFIPIVRTFTPIVAGASRMPHRKFSIYNVIGALIWAVGVTLLGYIAGDRIAEEYFEIALIGIGLITAIPMVLEFRSEYRHNARERARSGSAPDHPA